MFKWFIIINYPVTPRQPGQISPIFTAKAKAASRARYRGIPIRLCDGFQAAMMTGPADDA
ncbi:MAG: hypothetical protein LBK65_02495 [Tannerellaceae bacterium]|nr:hypothetical protein [Tannerellaceae bacterium]